MFVVQMLLSFLLHFTLGTQEQIFSYFTTPVEITSSVPKSKKEIRLREALVKSARKYVGSKYKYGGMSPRGFDCSGFVNYVLHQYGYEGGRSSNELANRGLYTPKFDVSPGDLIFFGTNNKISHVALVTEVGRREIKIIHSTSSKGVIEENFLDSPYWNTRFMFARNIISRHR